MIVESVELKDYRNYEFLDMKFNAHVNIIYGDNAQGKTNILESIYMCALSPYRINIYVFNFQVTSWQ